MKINPGGSLQKIQLMELMLNIWKVKIAMKYVTEINDNSKFRKKASLSISVYPPLADIASLTNILKFKWYYFLPGILTTAK